MCIYTWDPENLFFLVIRLGLFFLVITAMHFVQANVAIYVFFQYFRTPFFNNMLKNYGFAMPLASEPKPYMAIFAHIWPYMTNFFGHPESAASIRFDHFFYPLRLFLINDQKNCPFRDLAIMTKKKWISGFQVYIYIYVYIKMLFPSIVDFQPNP